MNFTLPEDLLLALNIVDRVDELTMERFDSADLVVEILSLIDKLKFTSK